jgi:3-phenylpropionate/trans-cinnamate dioxygenase ferredoxin reductase subunit
MQNLRSVVVVGAGVAGQRAAETLRAHGYDGRIVLVGAEAEAPYDRTALSKDVLQGKRDVGSLFLQDARWYAENEVELITGAAAVSLDTRDRLVTLAGGRRLNYDAVLCATGCRVRRLRVPGAELPGVYYLRTLADATVLRRALAEGHRVVVIGAGFIGAEVAASCRSLGLQVTVIEALALPLIHVLGREMAQICADLHRDHGVVLYTEETVAALRGGGRVEEVVTSSGRRIPCDLVVVGIGVEPATEWLTGSGVQCDGGVLVDEFCRTNVPGVFAAGDVARWPFHKWGEYIRVEHWDHAANHGAAAALSILGKGAPYQQVPYFWSDQYDVRFQYVGHANRWDQLVIRGSVRERAFTAFYVLEDRVVAALCVNRARDVMAARRLIAGNQRVDPHLLRDDAVDLRRLADG